MRGSALGRRPSRGLRKPGKNNVVYPHHSLGPEARQPAYLLVVLSTLLWESWRPKQGQPPLPHPQRVPTRLWPIGGGTSQQHRSQSTAHSWSSPTSWATSLRLWCLISQDPVRGPSLLLPNIHIGSVTPASLGAVNTTFVQMTQPRALWAGPRPTPSLTVPVAGCATSQRAALANQAVHLRRYTLLL